MSSKGHFDDPEHIEAYVKFRSNIPSEIVRKLIVFLEETFLASECVVVDVGCGSGQSTIPLACSFKHVTGIDVSEAQIAAARERQLKNVVYTVGSGENIPLSDHSLHLVAAVNAVHWLNFDKFFNEVDRLLIPRGVMALVRGTPCVELKGYEEKTQELFQQLVNDTRAYWDEESKVHDYLYDTFEIPYRESVRDKSLIKEELLSIDYIVERVKTFSGISNFLRKDPAAADKVLAKYKADLMQIIGASGKSSEETVATLRRQFVLLMGRKP